MTANGIEIGRAPPYSKPENAIPERANWTIMETARSMMDHAGLPKPFWGEAVTHAADIWNICFGNGAIDLTSHELFIGRKPRVDHLRVFGSHAWVLVPKNKRTKLDSKSEEGLIVGCSDDSLYEV